MALRRYTGVKDSSASAETALLGLDLGPGVGSQGVERVILVQVEFFTLARRRSNSRRRGNAVRQPAWRVRARRIEASRLTSKVSWAFISPIGSLEIAARCMTQSQPSRSRASISRTSLINSRSGSTRGSQLQPSKRLSHSR